MIHDMTDQYWGHACYLHGRQDDGSWNASVIVTPKLQNGDYIDLRSKTHGITFRYKVKKVYPELDPPDMYTATLIYPPEQL